jgi:hypothetical protein
LVIAGCTSFGFSWPSLFVSLVMVLAIDLLLMNKRFRAGFKTLKKIKCKMHHDHTTKTAYRTNKKHWFGSMWMCMLNIKYFLLLGDIGQVFTRKDGGYVWTLGLLTLKMSYFIWFIYLVILYVINKESMYVSGKGFFFFWNWHYLASHGWIYFLDEWATIYKILFIS